LLTSKITGTPAQFAADFNDAIDAVAGSARSGDMILTLGAGSVSQLGPQILSELEARK
jgi:UDP-N-acetylmuramate--alanine ligase